jgi:4-amino-4-deoxy-L-arabinose transferase-like glycosyltransferase
MSETRRNSLSTIPGYLVLSAIISLGLFLRCFNIHQGLWWDEIWSTLEYAGASTWWYTISQLGFYFNNHPLYSILCRLSISVLGVSELSVRLPSVIMGGAALTVLYFLARPLTGTVPALLGTFLLSISAFHIDHSSEARGYAGLMLFGLLATLFFFKALGKGTLRNWLFFIVCTFLGFYSHIYMAQVSFVQVVCCVLLLVEQALRKDTIRLMYDGAFKHLVLALAVGAIATLTAYAPMLKFFIANAAKVSFFKVDRLPFVAEMYETVLPGFSTVPGMLLYSVLTVCGLLYLRKRSAVLCLYTILMCNLPLLLYLQLNPMFIFKRYFLPALPFVLLTLGCGMEWIARACGLSAKGRAVFFAVLLSAIVFMQWPAIRKITFENRQHYREAAAFVQKRAAEAEPLVFAIGYAGHHFSYYARVPVIVPETFSDFKERIDSDREVWCLITAWLPEMRPSHEPELLYTEDPQHQMIYDYVTSHFKLAKKFNARFPTYVYRRPQHPVGGSRAGQQGTVDAGGF